jgi:hypothetical protein
MREKIRRARYALRSDAVIHAAEWDGKPICGTKGKRLRISSIVKESNCKRCAKKAIDGCGLPL